MHKKCTLRQASPSRLTRRYIVRNAYQRDTSCPLLATSTGPRAASKSVTDTISTVTVWQHWMTTRDKNSSALAWTGVEGKVYHPPPR